MLATNRTRAHQQPQIHGWVRTAVAGLRLCLLGGLQATGCANGTDPSLLQGGDGASPPRDAASQDGSGPPGIPPIDQRTYEETAVATFALG